MSDLEGIVDGPDFNPAECAVPVSVEIGPESERGSHLFEFRVVTSAYVAKGGSLGWCRALLLVNEFDWKDVENMVELLLGRVVANDWDSAIRVLCLYLDWEYAGMISNNGEVMVPANIKCGT